MGMEFHLKRIIELNDDDGCTIVWMYLIALNFTFEIVKMAGDVAQW
jgi:hypothetical protein